MFVSMTDDDDHNPGPPRPLSDFTSPERFAKFNAETRGVLKRELVREEEELAAGALRQDDRL